jgi:RNA polymerase sigma-B factor
MATAVRRSALERLASHSCRDAVVREFLPLADALARRFQRRFPDLIELDDARQVARFELIRAAACLKAGFHPAPFLKPRIQGALQHYLRDHGRLVRVSRREHEKGIHPLGHQSLDAVGPDERPLLDTLASPVSEEAPASEGLGEIEARMTARVFAAVHHPERGPVVRAVLEQLLLVLDATSPDGVI